MKTAFADAAEREQAVVIAAGIVLIARVFHFGHLQDPDRDIDHAFKLATMFVTKMEQRLAALGKP